MSPLDASERQCAACGAVDPPGGLRLGPEGGGADYEWFCKRNQACLDRIAKQMKKEKE